MRKKSIVIILSLITAFSIISLGYAKWQKELFIIGNIKVKPDPDVLDSMYVQLDSLYFELDDLEELLEQQLLFEEEQRLLAEQQALLEAQKLLEAKLKAEEQVTEQGIGNNPVDAVESEIDVNPEIGKTIADEVEVDEVKEKQINEVKSEKEEKGDTSKAHIEDAHEVEQSPLEDFNVKNEAQTENEIVDSNE